MDLHEKQAFPTLTKGEMQRIKPLATIELHTEGSVVFRHGQKEIDLFIVEAGQLEIQNPADENSVIVVHHPGEFAGDIDLLTGRPVIVTAIARGNTTLLRVPFTKMKLLLNRIPSIGEKLIMAFVGRRELLAKSGKIGISVYGGTHCKDTHLVREFFYKNFVPFTWFDTDTEEGARQMQALGEFKRTPVIDCGDNRKLIEPTLRELAECAGVWKPCPQEVVDLAIVGAGPAGITSAVYAASEGLNTVLIDRLGPGGQAGGSSKIENFIGFPAGLSGAELAMRGVLQMLKFGARMAAPFQVERLEFSKVPGQPHRLHLDAKEVVQAKVVLISTGVQWKKLPVENALRFEGAGVHYVCTTVEAHLYDTCDVAVVGAGNSAGQAVMFLAECCTTRKVHMIIRNKLGAGMSEYLVTRIRSTNNIVVHEGAEITAITGKEQLEEITVSRKGDNTQEKMACSAIFVFIGADPAAAWLPPEIARDAKGYILTGNEALRSKKWPAADRDPCPLETTIPGILAAGDIRTGSTKRVGFAVGDGSLAVTCTHQLLSVYHETR